MQPLHDQLGLNRDDRYNLYIEFDALMFEAYGFEGFSGEGRKAIITRETHMARVEQHLEGTD